MTIKHNSVAYLGCVVDGMSIMFHISKFGTKCNVKHMPMCFFINIQTLAIGLYKQYLFFHTLDTLQCTSYRVQSFKAITSFIRLIHKSVCFGYPKNTKGYTASTSRILYFHAQWNKFKDRQAQYGQGNHWPWVKW